MFEMGIPHLYHLSTRECLIDINIIDEIGEWYRQNPGKKPTIVFDYASFAYSIRFDTNDIFFGRRSLSIFKQVEQFFTKLREMGVELVFFEDGPMQPDKCQTVTGRKNQFINYIFKILDALNLTNSVKEIFAKEHELGRFKTYGIGSIARLLVGIRKIAKKFGEFQTSYHNECDKEVAAYAIKTNAMAVFSNDTDYLIFSGEWKYWSSNNLNLQEMTTKYYDKLKLQRHLNLTEDEMPLLATLAGNDLISVNELKYFHQRIRVDNSWNKFKTIGRFINRYFREQEAEEERYLKKIANHVFGREEGKYTELVRKSLNSYNITVLHEDNDTEFMQRMKTIDNDCYKYLSNMTDSFDISYFDLRKPPFKQFTTVVLKLKQRQMGIILQHKNDKTITRNIYGYDNKRYVCKTLKPEYPSIEVPDLADLYDDKKNVEHEIIKLQLIAWVLSDRLDFNMIQNIHNDYFVVCLVLYFMVENSFITVREADIFLHSIETVYTNFSSDIDLPYLESVHPRVFQLVFLYNNIYFKIKAACENCGLFKLEADHMDGLYFHHAYKKLNNLDENQPLNVHLRLYEGLDKIKEPERNNIIFTGCL